MMSNLQFYFEMGVPSVLILLAWLQANQSAARIEATVDRLSTELNASAKDMRNEMITLRDSIHRDMIGLHERTARVEERMK